MALCRILGSKVALHQTFIGEFITVASQNHSPIHQWEVEVEHDTRMGRLDLKVEHLDLMIPSEVRFFAAMTRKNNSPRAPDMKVVVPIHNAVNERAWSRIREWETGRCGESCGGVRRVCFKGRPGEPSPKARILTLLGFYAGQPLLATSNVSFLDACVLGDILWFSSPSI